MSKYTFDNDGKVVRKSDGLPPFDREIQLGDNAYRAMLAADDAFQHALCKQYGRNAGDFRYQTNKLTPAVLKLALEYQESVERYRATFAE